MKADRTNSLDTSSQGFRGFGRPQGFLEGFFPVLWPVEKWKDPLLGTAGSWFMLDVAFYGLNLNTTFILGAIGYGGGPNVYHILYNMAAGSAILVCAGAIPGYWTSVALIDIVGRKPIQLMGFICLTILFIVWGFDFNNLKPHAHLAVFTSWCSTFFNFGKLLKLSMFQSKLRQLTCIQVPTQPLSSYLASASQLVTAPRLAEYPAASGKIGSIIGQAAIAKLRTRGATPKTVANPWQYHVMEIYAAFMFAGIFTTLCIPETKRRTLEDLSGDDQVYGNGAPAVADNASDEAPKERVTNTNATV